MKYMWHQLVIKNFIRAAKNTNAFARYDWKLILISQEDFSDSVILMAAHSVHNTEEWSQKHIETSFKVQIILK